MFRTWTFWRLFGTFGLLWLASIGLLGWIVIGRVDEYENRRVLNSVRVRARLTCYALRGHTDDDLQRHVEELKSRAGGARVTLIAENGDVTADSDEDPDRMENHGGRPEVVRARGPEGEGSATRFSDTLRKPMLYVAVRPDPEDHLGPRVAVVRVALPVDMVEAQVAGLHRVVWTAAALAGLAAVCLSFWLARKTVLPLTELTTAAELIAEGAFGHKVYASGPDVIGALARTFNHMSARLARQFAQLEEDRQQLRAILSGMVEGVIALDADERILFVNDRAARLLGFLAPAAVGRHLWEAVRQRSLQDLVRRALAEPEPLQEELRWNGPAPRSLTVHAARLSAGGAVLVLHDTTDLRRLERVRQDFVTNVSHELKTPLAVIKACVETLLDGAAEDPHHRGRFLERISDQADRLYALILDLLSLARIESGEEAFEPRAVPLGPAVGDCLERHRARAEAKRQRLTTDAPPEGGDLAAHVDEEALGQILDNLVENAVKYTPEGSRIVVRWRADDGQVRLEVEDNGQGIPEADLPRIFERFYRVDKARSREMGGTGLGLAIVKHLTQAMKGGVRAASRVGHGTTFTVSLPRATGQEEPTVPSQVL